MNRFLINFIVRLCVLTLWMCDAAAGQTKVYRTRFSNVTWDHDKWLLSTSNLDQGHYQARATVANGYHGISVAALGPFFEAETPVNGDNIGGWPLFERRQTFATVGGFWDSQPQTNGSNFPWLYQYGWDSVISGIPHWGGIVLDVGNDEYLDAATSASTISNFSSSLNMQQGLLSWSFAWNTSKGTFDIAYEMFAHKALVNQGFVQMHITAHSDVNVTVANVLNGDCALRTNPVAKGTAGSMVFSAVSPFGVADVSAHVYASLAVTGAQILYNHTSWNAPYVGTNQSSIASATDVTLLAGRTAAFTKFVGVASTDAFPDAQNVALTAVETAMQAGYDASVSSHIAEWAAVFPKSSVDDFVYPANSTLPDDPYVVDSAIIAVVNPYYLLQNTISVNASALVNVSLNVNSISVGGLGSASYAGQVFWDTDVWMHPGLVTTFPYAASSITNYRKRLYPQAQTNIETAYQSSKNSTSFPSGAAVYPWTSGRYGNCTATGPCFDYQYHLNGDIVLSLEQQWLASGDVRVLQDDLYPIHQSVATLYSALLQQNGSLWSLANMTDPDEYANQVDNGGFTMALIADTLNRANTMRESFNASTNTTWSSQAQNVLIGRNTEAGIVLEYTGPTPQNGSIAVKQADVVLISFPLSYFNENYTATNATSDLDYYDNKQSLDGPGMTYAIFSIVASEVSRSGCSSYTYQQYSFAPYVRAPWFQFSEQLIDDASINGGTHPAFPFLTGHGGANQVVPYGYLGLRYVSDGYLHVDPAPPPQLPNIRYRTIYYQGWPVSAVSNITHTVLSRPDMWSPSSGATPNATFAHAPIPVLVGPLSSPGQQQLYQLAPNSFIVLPNRQYWRNTTVPDNVAQCRSRVESDTTYLPGQFPISAVDGSTSTRWQPTFANKTASITVDLPLGHRVVALDLDWAANVPLNFSVTFHNATDPNCLGSRIVASNSNITISNPYNASAALQISKIIGNTTRVLLNESSRGTTEGVWTAAYATLSIWGNQANGTYTVQNMSGNGATVSEFAVIVDKQL